jgi:hypothetical protein
MANNIPQEAIDFDSLSPEFTFNIGSIHARWRDLKYVLDEKEIEYTMLNVVSIMFLAFIERHPLPPPELGPIDDGSEIEMTG